MKRIFLPVRIALIGVVLFLCLPGINARAQTDRQTPDRLRDSLTVLDSLVNATKISNIRLSVMYAHAALDIATRLQSDSALALANTMLGTAYFATRKDSSYFYFSNAFEIASRNDLVRQQIPAMYNLAMIYNAAFNYREAIKLLDSSIVLAKSMNDKRGESRAYLTLGTLYENTHDFERAQKMYQLALQVASGDSLLQQMGVALGNLAKDEFEQDRKKAMAVNREALRYLKRVKGAEEEMASILINMGNRFTNPDSALFYYQSALNLAVNAHLPTILCGAYNNMAYSYLDKKNSVMAESCLKDHAIPVALQNNDHDWLSSLYDTYADVYTARGDYQKALAMQKLALKERVRDTRQKASEQLRLLAALLDLKNKEITIQSEEKELLLQRNRLQRMELGLAVSLILVLFSVFIILFLQLRNRARIHREQVESARKIIEMEETEKGRTARELHDLTGQLVMGISGAIENTEFGDPEVKEEIRARVLELGSSIRKISHRMNRAMIEHFTFNELIEGMCDDYRKLSGLEISLIMPDQFPTMAEDVVLHFYRIAQELLTNASKYAASSQITLEIIDENERLVLFYTDDGPGFDPGQQPAKSMGLRNVYERAKLCHGKVSLKSAPGEGTTWEIEFPLHHTFVKAKQD